MALILSAYVLQDTVSSASPLGFTIGVFFFRLLREEGKKSREVVGKGKPEKEFYAYLSKDPHGSS